MINSIAITLLLLGSLVAYKRLKRKKTKISRTTYKSAS